MIYTIACDSCGVIMNEDVLSASSHDLAAPRCIRVGDQDLGIDIMNGRYIY